jgi:hypothetical protein
MHPRLHPQSQLPERELTVDEQPGRARAVSVRDCGHLSRRGVPQASAGGEQLIPADQRGFADPSVNALSMPGLSTSCSVPPQDGHVVTMSEVAYLALRQEAASTSTGLASDALATGRGWYCPPAKGRFCQSTTTV